MAIVRDLSGNGLGSFSLVARDWTDGAGVFPAGASFTVADPAAGGGMRKWLYVQNQGVATVTIQYGAVNGIGGGATPTLVLSPGAGVGAQGGADERDVFKPTGAVVVAGTAGEKVVILEVVG